MSNSIVQPESSKPLPLRNAARSRAQMDALRFGSIFLIMIHHFYHMQKPVGTIGTHFFFALTGFLVASSLMKLREQVLAGENSPLKTWYQFTTRRWMRVLPVMWIMLTACFILLSKSDRAHALWHYALLSNIRMSIDGNYPDYIAHLWWISAIEQTLPFLVLLFMVTPKHHLQNALGCVILVGPIFRIVGYFMQWNYISMRVLPPAFIDIVGMGCLLAVAMKHGNTRLVSIIKWVGIYVGLPMMCYALWTIQQTTNDLNKSIFFDIGSTWAVCALVIISYNEIRPMVMPSFTSWAPVSLIRFSLLSVFRGAINVIGDVLASRVLTYFGAISYGLAMWHLFAMAWMTKYFNGSGPHVRAAGSFAIATLVASGTYFLIERPVTRIKSKITARKPNYSAIERAPSGNTMPGLAKS